VDVRSSSVVCVLDKFLPDRSAAILCQEIDDLLYVFLFVVNRGKSLALGYAFEALGR
jgi:hypothetical protein